MAKLKLRRRLKNPFVKRKSGGGGGGGDGPERDDEGRGDDNRHVASDESRHSGIKQAGGPLPLLPTDDFDDTRLNNHSNNSRDTRALARKKNKKKKDKGKDGGNAGIQRRRSRSASRERRGSKFKPSELPKISENRSTCTPSLASLSQTTPKSNDRASVDNPPSPPAATELYHSPAPPTPPAEVEVTLLQPATPEEPYAVLPSAPPVTGRVRSGILLSRSRSNASHHHSMSEGQGINDAKARSRSEAGAMSSFCAETSLWLLQPLEPPDVPQSPVSVLTEAAESPGWQEVDSSSGAQSVAGSVNTVGGRDMFERSRSSMTVSRAQQQRHQYQQQQDHDSTATPTPKSSNRKSKAARAPGREEFNESPVKFQSSLQNARSASPSVLGRIHAKRERSSTPNTITMMEEAGRMVEEAEKMTAAAFAADPLGDKQDTNEGARHMATPVREICYAEKKKGEKQQGRKKGQQMSKTSPTSVLHAFDSKYGARQDSAGSCIEDENDDADFPRCRDDVSGMDARQQQDPPAMPPTQPPGSPSSVEALAKGRRPNNFFDASPSNRPSTPPQEVNVLSKSSSSSSSQRNAAAAPPNMDRHSPSGTFKEGYSSIQSSVPWDPLTYTSLEDAVLAQAAMLTGTSSSTSVTLNRDSVAAAISKDYSRSSSNGSSKRSFKRNISAPSAPAVDRQFPAYANDESSVVGSVSVMGSVMGSVMSSSRVSYSSRGTIKSKAGDDAPSKEFLEQKKKIEKNEFKKLVFFKKVAAGPGGVGATVSPEDATRMSSAEPQENIELRATPVVATGEASDPPGVDATAACSASLEKPPEDPPGSSFPRIYWTDDTPQTQLASDIVINVIQSFSFDQDTSVQYSLSDDSCSYLSELESIADITICEETVQMLEAHKLYEEGAKTNRDHPMRKSGSIMKVGSQFREDSLSSSIRALKWSEQRIATATGIGPKNVKNTPSISSESAITESVAGKKLTWYDDEINWDKPFMLRTDESFDATTVTTLEKGVGAERINVVDGFWDDFIKGIEKYANCGGGDDVESFDASGQNEI